jgi:S-adenosylmethionine:tRNA ribosyltransferase-isomerase
MSDHRFTALPDLLEPGDLIVVNETRVRAARLIGRRVGTGGKVELLLLDRSADGRWRALAKPSRRLRPGVEIAFEGMTVKVLEPAVDGVITVDLDAEDEEEAISRAGTVPLPPYFEGELDDAARYQTIYANTPGSSAAPTAGLHFTDEVMVRLDARGIGVAKVDLHVSLDTFRPMSVDRIEDHQIHSEWCSVSEATKEAIDATRARDGRIVAIGTTVVRTLESFADGHGGVDVGSQETDLFLRPGYEFQVVDGLVTNFHLPRSTLLVLLAAFMGPVWRMAYETALERGYRFLSFGDAMYAERLQPGQIGSP